jgi:hypothetical protein
MFEKILALGSPSDHSLPPGDPPFPVNNLGERIASRALRA